MKSFSVVYRFIESTTGECLYVGEARSMANRLYDKRSDHQAFYYFVCNGYSFHVEYWVKPFPDEQERLNFERDQTVLLKAAWYYRVDLQERRAWIKEHFYHRRKGGGSPFKFVPLHHDAPEQITLDLAA